MANQRRAYVYLLAASQTLVARGYTVENSSETDVCEVVIEGDSLDALRHELWALRQDYKVITDRFEREPWRLKKSVLDAFEDPLEYTDEITVTVTHRGKSVEATPTSVRTAMLALLKRSGFPYDECSVDAVLAEVDYMVEMGKDEKLRNLPEVHEVATVLEGSKCAEVIFSSDEIPFDFSARFPH